MFYTFEQNYGNHMVMGEIYRIIQAESSVEANEKALLHGIYFDGVNKDGKRDCSGCGNRWLRVQEKDGTLDPMINGQSPSECTREWVIITESNTKCFNMSQYYDLIKITDILSDEESRKKALERLMALVE